MRPWPIVATVVAALAILILLAYGSDGRDASGRAKEGIDERAAQPLVSVPVVVGPEQATTIVLERGYAPPEAKSLIEEARNLLVSAENQPPEQAKATLEQANEKLEAASDLIEDAANDTSPSNFITRIRLERTNRVLQMIQDLIEASLQQM